MCEACPEMINHNDPAVTTPYTPAPWEVHPKVWAWHRERQNTDRTQDEGESLGT